MEEKLVLLEEKIKGEKKEKFDCFRSLLLEYNEKFNLTSIIDEKEIFYKHFLDSLAGESFIPFNAKGCEVGSGAGFPSVPLKILRDDLSFDLFESVGKKCEFLKVIVDKLGFSEVNIYNIRAEDAARKENFREKYDFCTARAVARMNSLAEYCMPLVKKGGIFLAYKGGDTAEIKEAEKAVSVLGGKILNLKRYSLPEEMGERSLVEVKKISSTPSKYPRGQGKERKNPIL